MSRAKQVPNHGLSKKRFAAAWASKEKPQHCIHAPVRCVDKNVPVDKHRPAQSRASEVNPLEIINPGYRPNNSCVIYSHCNPPCRKVPKRPSP
ncbi:hypothetical protein HDV57DRAFT_260828 [Trichoderma longibrachiatum]